LNSHSVSTAALLSRVDALCWLATMRPSSAGGAATKHRLSHSLVPEKKEIWGSYVSQNFVFLGSKGPQKYAISVGSGSHRSQLFAYECIAVLNKAFERV